jgi:hypothetical protein
MNVSKVDCGLANPELGQEIPATLQFRYAFSAPFMSVAEAFLKNYNWEAKTRLTTIDSVEQLDEDRVVVYRRHESYD